MGARLAVRPGRLALSRTSPPCPALARPCNARGCGPAGRLSQQSRPPRRGGGGGLDLCRPAGDEAGRSRERAPPFRIRHPLHHGGRGRLHGRGRAQDDARPERLRADPQRHLARARGRGGGEHLHLAGRAGHPLRQRHGGEFLRGASGPRPGRRLRGGRRDQVLGQSRPHPGGRRLDRGLFAPVQI